MFDIIIIQLTNTFCSFFVIILILIKEKRTRIRRKKNVLFLE